MGTLANLTTRIKHNLYGAHPTDMPFVSILGAAIANGTTTSVTVASSSNWDIGDILEVEETGEQVFITTDGTPLTVIRGFNGTTAAAAADAGVVVKNPRFTQKQIEHALDAVVQTLSSWGIHKFSTTSITRVTLQDFYELNVSVDPQYGVLSAYYVEENTKIPVPVPFKQVYLNLGTDPTEYSVGKGVHILDWGQVIPGEKVYVTYAEELDAVTDLSTRHDELLVAGATAYLMGMTIVPSTQEPGARTDRTKQGGQESRDARWWQGEFFVRVRAEAAQLAVQRSRFPTTTRLARARRWRH